MLFVLLALLFVGCDTSESDEPTLKSFTLKVDQEVTQSVNLALPFPTDFGQVIRSDWALIQDDHRGGLSVSIPNFRNSPKVQLPHRVQLPDQSIWYQTNLELGEGVLRLNADDGAQLWLNGERVKPVVDNYYPVNESGQLKVTIRVMNNAMAGGLRSVKFVPKSEWEELQALKERRALLRKILAKKELIIGLTAYEDWLIEKAINTPSKENLLTATRQLAIKPILLADPILQKDDDGKLYLRWVSTSDEEAVFAYGSKESELDGELSLKGKDGVFLTQIDPSLKYYKIKQGESVSQVFELPSVVKKEGQRFMVWADSQSGWKVFDAIMRMSNQYEPEFTIGAGDLVGQGDDDLEYLRFLRSLGQGETVHYPVPGNHDYDGYYEDLKPNNFSKYLGLPEQENYFAWREKNSAFIALDLNENFPVDLPESSIQYRWFMEQIQSEAWTSAEWRFLILHHPPYSQGWPGYHGEISIREVLEPLYEKAKIDLVIAGHTHDYERLIKDFGTQQTAFVIVGGAGGGLEPVENAAFPKMDTVLSIHHFGLIKVTNDTLNFKAIDLDNNIIDNFFLTHD